MSSAKDLEAEKYGVEVPGKDQLEKQVDVVDLVPDWQPSKEQQKRVLRKIDLLLIPLMCGCVLCMYALSLIPSSNARQNSVELSRSLEYQRGDTSEIKLGVHLDQQYFLFWIPYRDTNPCILPTTRSIELLRLWYRYRMGCCGRIACGMP